MANLNAPSSTAGASAREPSPSTASTGRRLSTKGRALKRFLRRLIPPFSTASSSTPSQPSASEGTTDTATTEGEQPKTSNPPSSSQNQDPGKDQPNDKMAVDARDAEADKENQPPKTENGTASAMAKLSLDGRHSYEKPILPMGLKLTAEGLRSSAPKPTSIHQEFMDQALDMVSYPSRTPPCLHYS
jgi:hypothetical protein